MFAKHYLFDLILKSLESYHTGVDADLKSVLHRIEILFEKGMYDACERILVRAKKTAAKYERQTFLLEFCRWEIELARARSYVGKTEEDIHELFETIFKTIDNCRIENEYSSIVSKLFVKEVKGGFARTKKDLQVYDAIIKNLLLQKEKHAASFQSSYYFNLSYIGYHSIRNEYGKAYAYSQKLVELLESNPHQIAEKPRTYVSALKNLISCLGKLKRYKDILPVIKKMRAISTRSEAITNTIFYSANILELETCLHIPGQFEKRNPINKRI